MKPQSLHGEDVSHKAVGKSALVKFLLQLVGFVRALYQ